MASTAGAHGKSPASELLDVIGDILELMEPPMLRLWRATGMTFAQRRVLWRLQSNPLPAGRLADAVGVAPPTLTRVLDRLEERGLILRSADPEDRRRVMVALTPGGEAALRNYTIFQGTSIEHAAEAMPADRRDRLAAELRVLTAAAREQREERSARELVRARDEVGPSARI